MYEVSDKEEYYCYYLSSYISVEFHRPEDVEIRRWFRFYRLGARGVLSFDMKNFGETKTVAFKENERRNCAYDVTLWAFGF
jgi:hypothetical protein